MTIILYSYGTSLNIHMSSSKFYNAKCGDTFQY